MIWQLDQLPQSAWKAAGGKARNLARLKQAGYPVPDGLVITAGAFEEGELRPAAWDLVQRMANSLKSQNGASALAVRSSAAGEDSLTASFAGEFDTVLDVSTDKALFEAIRTVYFSREGAQAAAYAEAQRLDGAPEMAVIVQVMVPADLAGVLFTADPVTGSETAMTGNFVRGLGDRLVSGEADAERFALRRPSGAYQGPSKLAPLAKRLFRLGERLARDLGGPQDIEWAVAGGMLYILQSRPITTMQPYNPATGEWNDSRRGDYLWSNANFGEAIPGVMTPLTWSLVKIYGEETFRNPLPGDHPLLGNIGGRFYINLSLFTSMMVALGLSRERMNRESQELFGNLPEDVPIPTIPFSRGAVLRRFLLFAVRSVLRRVRNLRALATFTADVPARERALRNTMQAVDNPEALADIWKNEFEPLLRRAYQMLQAGTSKYENAYRPLHGNLVEQVGEAQANLLLSGVSSDGTRLASLGPLVGLWQVAHGEISREDYLRLQGHRGTDEFEVSWPRPAEDTAWLDRQLKMVAGVDVPALLARRAAEKEAAWARFTERYPAKAAATARKMETAAAAARDREAIRSEVTRLMSLARAFALRAGQLTPLGEDVFFLALEELLAVLNGGEADGAQIAVRRQAHERLSALPPYPALIRGRFDPRAWAADPIRRTDIYDALADREAPGAQTPDDLIRGLPGSAGVAEGTVRRLENTAEGHLLQTGEILVAVTTNVGWTPLFPRAAAVVTDVGAPLSHAAIVARELGIPAVIGTGDATMRLKTGDRVRVDGTHGTVERLAHNP